MSSQQEGVGRAATEAAGTSIGLYVARWVEPRIKATLSTALENLRIKTPQVYSTLVYGWKTYPDYRSDIDRTTILGITAINTLAGRLTKQLGPFSEVADEIVERVISALPDILPEVLDPVAEKYQPAQGQAKPSRAELGAAMKTYLQTFGEALPRMIVGQIDTFNPSRWLTRMGEQMQQAINACGPLAMLAMANFWMNVLTKRERKEYAFVFYAFNTPEEVMNFLGLPNDKARRLHLKMLDEQRRGRFLLSPNDLRRIRGELNRFYRNILAPTLQDVSSEIRSWRSSWRRDHPELFAPPPEPRRWDPRLERFRPFLIPIVLVIIFLAALASNVIYR